MQKEALEKYLTRIAYKDALEPTLVVLQDLQKAHLLSVPFENLDIHYGNRIELDIAKIYDKIVNRHRGGFCYELNSLFCELLKNLGFEVKMISARVRNKEGGFSREYDHMALIVRIEGVDYLVDVGFGKFSFGPLKLALGLVQKDKEGDFKIEKYDDEYWQVSKKQEEGWISEYIFTLTARNLDEYSAMCHYHQTSPDSHFTQKAVCSLPTEGGRITVSRNKVLLNDGIVTKEITIENEAQFLAHLKKYFQIKIN